VSGAADPAGSPAFWLERWETDRTAFHRAEPDPWLVAHAARLAPRGDECVLVPLCGKTVDLSWLERRGHSVVGVDVAEKGLRAFLTEQGRTFAEHPSPPFHVFATGRIELWRGDVFDLDPARHGTFDAIWDRAATIALPAERRGDYAHRLLDLLAPGGRILLVGLEYDVARMNGPPFMVSRREVARLFGKGATPSPGGPCVLEELGARSILEEEPRFKERGLDALVEYALLITKPR
jgi:thiopurine S-methyltransferase